MRRNLGDNRQDFSKPNTNDTYFYICMAPTLEL